MFDFCALPAEIRNHIYDELFTFATPITLNPPLSSRQQTSSETSPPSQDPPKKLHVDLALLRVNRKINREAKSHFLANNTFEFKTATALAQYLQTCGFFGRKCLRSVVLHHFLPDDTHFTRSAGEADHVQALAKAMVMLNWCPRLSYFGILMGTYVPWTVTQVHQLPQWAFAPNWPLAGAPAPPAVELLYSVRRVALTPGLVGLKAFTGPKGMEVEFVFDCERDAGLREKEVAEEWRAAALKFLQWEECALVGRYREMTRVVGG